MLTDCITLLWREILGVPIIGRWDLLGLWRFAKSVELASRLDASFAHLLRSANADEDLLAEEGVGRSSLFAVSFPST